MPTISTGASYGFAARGWYVSTNNYKGLFDYEPTDTVTSGYNTGAKSQWSLYMPKWQQDDIYENNFRLNKGDGVTMYYKDSLTAAAPFTVSDDTPFSSSGQQTLATGAVSLGAAAALVVSAAALTF
jgi:hypothetical protein